MFTRSRHKAFASGWKTAAPVLLISALLPPAALAQDDLLKATLAQDSLLNAGLASKARATRIEFENFEAAGDPGIRADRSRNLAEVGAVSYDGADVLDVTSQGDAAYVSLRDQSGCGLNGIRILDLADPAAPVEIGAVPGEGFGTEEVRVADISTPHFEGTLLVQDREPCASSDGGLVFWDVTDPANPVKLGSAYDFAFAAANPGPYPNVFISLQHWIFTQDERAFVAVVPNVGLGAGQIRILDITDPANPFEAGAWGLGISADAPAAEPTGRNQNLFAADVRVDESGRTAYLSYWDAGFILLDVSDPTNPMYLGSRGTEEGEEGNAYHAAPARGGNIFLGSYFDSDDRLQDTMETSVPLGSFGTTHDAIEAAFTPPVLGPFGPEDVAWVGKAVAGEPGFENFFRDLGCAANPGDPAAGPFLPYGEDVAGKIALIKRGNCRFDEKVAVAEAQGAIGVIVFNNIGDTLLTMGGDPIVGIPAFFVKQSRGEALAALRENDQPVQATLTPGPFDGYGFVRFMDSQDPTEITDLGALKLASTTDPGGLPTSALEFEVRGSSAYIAWFGEGLIVADFSNPRAPRVIARSDNEELSEIALHGALILGVEDSGTLRIFKHVPQRD